jgi:hypothetical protein
MGALRWLSEGDVSYVNRDERRPQTCRIGDSLVEKQRGSRSRLCGIEFNVGSLKALDNIIAQPEGIRKVLNIKACAEPGIMTNLRSGLNVRGSQRLAGSRNFFPAQVDPGVHHDDLHHEQSNRRAAPTVNVQRGLRGPFRAVGLWLRRVKCGSAFTYLVENLPAASLSP